LLSLFVLLTQTKEEENNQNQIHNVCGYCYEERRTTLRLSRSPELLNKEAHAWRVRSKRLLDGGAFRQ